MSRHLFNRHRPRKPHNQRGRRVHYSRCPRCGEYNLKQYRQRYDEDRDAEFKETIVDCKHHGIRVVESQIIKKEK